MSIRRFVATTARDALRQAREALGDDAMILANRQIESGVEVLALNEHGLAALESGTSSGALAAGQGAAGVGERSLPAEVMQALGALRGAVETRIDGILWGERLRRAPVGVTVYRSLLGAGFSAALARALSERVPEGMEREAALQWVRRELGAKLPVQADEDRLLREGGVFALVGPTGVGKTTTTAKLAARCVLKFGADQVAMLTTDGYRIGAHEQLRIYGRILGVPVLPAGDTAALREALAELQGRHVILVDTVGMSQRDRQVAEQAAMLCGAGADVHRLLVLNAASQGDTLDEVAHAYRQDKATPLLGCVLSKVDEATHLGAVLDTAIRHRLPIHYVSHGQKVPEHLTLPDASRLVERAMTLASARSLFVPSEADFAVLRQVSGDAAAAVAGTASGATPSSATEAGSAGADPQTATTPHSEAGQRKAEPASPAQARYRRHLRLAVAASAPRGGQAAFDQALHDLKDERALSVAQQLWRHYAAGETDLGLATDTVMADVRAHLSQTCDRHVIAWHAAARSASGTQLRVVPSVLLSDRGEALAIPVCHVASAQGMLTTQSETPSLPLQVGDTALARAHWLARQIPEAAWIHAYETLPLRIMQACQQEGQAWVSHCPESQRIVHDGHTLTVKGLAGSLGYLPAGASNDQAGTLWVAVARVALPGRASPNALGYALRLVVTRLIDADGRCRAQQYLLAAVPGAITANVLGRWAVTLSGLRSIRGWIAAAEQRLALAAEPHQPLPARLLPSAQLGLAAWQARWQPASPTALVLGLNDVAARRLDPVIDAMLRLFAALELTAEGAA